MVLLCSLKHETSQMIYTAFSCSGIEKVGEMESDEYKDELEDYQLDGYGWN